MKGLKKLALATAVAAAPFAQAEMTAMDDALLEEMTGQAGITIDVNLDMTIDAIKYVDQDGDQTGAGTQGAITLKTITMTDEVNGYARIAGITIDADGTDGLVMGLNQIGDDQGNGIDITVEAVMINNGMANLNNYNALQTADAAYNNAPLVNIGLDSYRDGTAAGTLAAIATPDAQALSAAMVDAEAQALGYADAATLDALVQETAGTAEEQVQAKLAVAGYGAAQAAGGSTNTLHTALVPAGQDLATMQAAGAAIREAGNGNIGGFAISNFRNYIQDTLVNKYNGVFDMALADSTGAITDVNSSAAGRFVRGEIVINGTGNYVDGTSGLRISGEFGGAMDKLAWVDDGGEFGVADMGFFHGVDNNGDDISDTIEGMHFQVDIDVVDDHTSSVAGTNMSGGAIAVNDTVSALRISNMAFTGTIMMGDIYVGNTTTGTSLGSVLIKDIDMTGTEVFIYGH